MVRGMYHEGNSKFATNLSLINNYVSDIHYVLIFYLFVSSSEFHFLRFLVSQFFSDKFKETEVNFSKNKTSI